MDFEKAPIKFVQLTVFLIVVVEKFEVREGNYFVIVVLIEDYSSRFTTDLMGEICSLLIM